ncbi:hypothetical protein M758_2G003000 [Ceratodon purpureus]|uniref:Uncharacterized protein n=1 Tax=Ceratodon purpureus TaxID=3225 RepID=A0A8T0IQ52_CERPU|nr:hypothetical protein KC19_2G003000 [Ceratodon purpureus]KAG0624777.1 hypothetical protein M758_2G003000 [Ceratodon purpureus]
MYRLLVDPATTVQSIAAVRPPVRNEDNPLRKSFWLFRSLIHSILKPLFLKALSPFHFGCTQYKNSPASGIAYFLIPKTSTALQTPATSANHFCCKTYHASVLQSYLKLLLSSN